MTPASKCWDAIVVGGGPAGLAAAIALRQRGLSVLVAEALTPPIDKACGEGLMPDALIELARLGVVLSAADGVEFDGIHFANRHPSDADSTENETVTASFRAGCGLGIRRLQLHSRLTQQALELGVELAWGSRVELREDSPLRIAGDEARYGYLVGADGQSSLVRRWAGLDCGKLISRRFGFRKHYRVAPWSGNVEVHWGALGQAYITPVGANEVCVAALTRAAGSTLEAVVKDMPWLLAKLGSATVCSRPRGAITTTRRLQRVVSGNIALVGDASGSVDAITGEGLAVGFRQALLLADAVHRGSLDAYQAGHGAILKMPQTMARVMLAMDKWPWFRGRAMRMLAADPALFARMLGVHVGEESLQSFLLRRGCQVGWRLLAPPAFSGSAV